MLLPSDVARLVLGYLQEEGLRATSYAFIQESPDLKEYAEHSIDGTIPACVFSLFGRNLTTILTEYASAKTKETSQQNQIPVMMTSLWKKLDFTLNQIKCLQNSPTPCQNQRLRTRKGVSNIRHQRALWSPRTMSTPQGMLGIATLVCRSSQQSGTTPLSVSQSAAEEGNLVDINMNHTGPEGSGAENTGGTSKRRNATETKSTKPLPLPSPSHLINNAQQNTVSPSNVQPGSAVTRTSRDERLSSTLSSVRCHTIKDRSEAAEEAVVCSMVVDEPLDSASPGRPSQPLLQPVGRRSCDPRSDPGALSNTPLLAETSGKSQGQAAAFQEVAHGIGSPLSEVELCAPSLGKNTPPCESSAPISVALPPPKEAISETLSLVTAAPVVTATPAVIREPDLSEVVSPAVIISDELPSDPVLHQAISSITGEVVPTIVFSAPPTAAASCITPEETAEAVSCLQRSEVIQAASVMEAGLEEAFRAATPAVEEMGYLHLLPAATLPRKHYFMTGCVTEGQQQQPVLPPLNPAPLGQRSALSHGLETLPLSKPAVSKTEVISSLSGVTTDGSTLHVSQPAGQKKTRKVAVAPNQMPTLLAAVNSQTESKPQPGLAPKHTAGAAKMGTGAGNTRSRPAVSPPSKEALVRTPVPDPQNQRRMVCFEVSTGDPVQIPGRTRGTLSPKLIGQCTNGTKFMWVKPETTASMRRCPGEAESSDTEPLGPSSPDEGSGPRSTTEDQRTETRSTSRRKGTTRPDTTQEESQTAPQNPDCGSGGESHTAPQIPDSRSREESQTTPQNQDSESRGGEKGAAHNGKTSTPDQALRSEVRHRGETHKRSKNREEGRAETVTPLVERHTTANKENELERQGQHEPLPATSTLPGASTPLSSPALPSLWKASCKTSPLTKMAAEILQDEQNPTFTASEPLPPPRTPCTGHQLEDLSDCQHGRDRDATPRHLSQTASPDVPVCSPASDSSVSSVGMAARTLIILSRATPLRDSHQQGAPHSKTTKRKHNQSVITPAARKQLQLSSSMRKAKKQKQMLDCLPGDLDVDKFLSSLHYDE